MFRDPVCGMLVDEKNPPVKTRYKDKDYYFCMEGCRGEFEKNPEKYTKEEVKDA